MINKIVYVWVLMGILFFTILIEAASGGESGRASIQSKLFGRTADGREVTLYELINANGLRAAVMDYGAILVNLEVPDRNGKLADINLGFDDFDPYIKRNPMFGAVVGRYANRIENARFVIDGVEYKITPNAGKDHIHGGNEKRFDRVMWKGEGFRNDDGAGVRLTYLSKDGDEGFPGNLNCTVTYTLTNKNELKINYQATTDKPTVVNMTNHGYFNLAGAGSGDVLGHEMMINAGFYTPGDKALIPTGEILSVKGTPLDFTEPKTIGARIEQLSETRGYDHNYVLKNSDGLLTLAARVYEPGSGRIMEVYTTQPGVQFYTANGMKNIQGKAGKVYQNHYGFCLETQHFPDSPNKPHFPSTVLRPGEKYDTTTVFKFSTE